MNEIEADVDELIDRLRAEYSPFMHVTKRPGHPAPDADFWSLEPINPKASPIWIIGVTWKDATVGFGRSDGRIELWQLGKEDAQEALPNLEDVCRSVIAGRLTEWRQDENRCRYELILTNGQVYRGSANVLFRRRWKTVEHFEAYAPPALRATSP